MKVTAVFIAVLGLAAAEVILGEGGAYSYTLDNSAPSPARSPCAEPATAPEPETEPATAPEPESEPATAPEPESEPSPAPEPKKEPEAIPELASPKYFYRLIPSDYRLGRIPYPYRMIDSASIEYAPSYIISSPASEGSSPSYSYRVINSKGLASYALPSIEGYTSPSYSYRIVSDSESPSSKPSSSVPSTIYNWFSGLPSLTDLSQYLPQLAQYRNPGYSYRYYYPENMASVVKVDEVKVEEVKVDEVMKDDVPQTYSYKQL